MKRLSGLKVAAIVTDGFEQSELVKPKQTLEQKSTVVVSFFILFVGFIHTASAIPDFFSSAVPQASSTFYTRVPLIVGSSLSFIGTFLLGYGVYNINRKEENSTVTQTMVDLNRFGPGTYTIKGTVAAALGLFCLFKGATILVQSTSLPLNEKC
jgi:hypothetical protein